MTNPMTTPSHFHTVRFLIVDDDEVSVMAITRSMNKLNVANPVSVAKNGVEALAHLENAIQENGGALPPYVITLDLNMPRMGGLEFLERVRNDPRLQKLSIFVLTTSDAPGDIASAYEKNIAGYIVKESPLEGLKNAIAMLRDYATLVVLPS